MADDRAFAAESRVPEVAFHVCLPARRRRRVQRRVEGEPYSGGRRYTRPEDLQRVLAHLADWGLQGLPPAEALRRIDCRYSGTVVLHFTEAGRPQQVLWV